MPTTQLTAPNSKISARVRRGGAESQRRLPLLTDLFLREWKMKNSNIRNPKNESGMVIVEASIVFPIMFFVLIILIYMGNAFYEKAQIDSIVVQKAISGSNYCSDPLLETLKTNNGALPSCGDLETEPYRYIFGGRGDIVSKISTEVEAAISTETSTFFSNMSPTIKTPSSEIAKFNNYVVYSTFSVDIEYVIKFPISFLGEDTPPMLTITSRAEVPVGDPAEFIRNTDMVIDYFHGTKIGQSISDAFGKLNDFISSFADM